MTTPDYRVHLDSPRGGIKPFPASDNPATNYERMRELAAWAIDNPASNASTDLRVRLVKFYTDVRIAYEKSGRDKSLSDLPSYDSYLDLVDAYNDERGYTNPLRPQADNQTDTDSPASTGSSHDDRPAWVDELIGAIQSSNSRPVRPSWRDRLAAAKATSTTTLHDLADRQTSDTNQPRQRPTRRSF